MKCKTCNGMGVIPNCFNCSHIRRSGNIGSICEKVNPLNVEYCKDWKKTKGFISNHNKCRDCNGTGKKPEQTDLAGLAARENGNDSNPDQKSQTEIKIIDSERKLFAEQYEKYLHLCSDQSNHIKELEQKIADMEYKEKYL